MVKTPRTRHSKTSREPVTIDLQPGEVSRVKAAAEQRETDAGKEASEAAASAGVDSPTASSAKPATEPTKRTDESPTRAEAARSTGPTTAMSPGDVKDKAETAKQAGTAASSASSGSSTKSGNESQFGRKDPAAAAGAQPPASGLSRMLLAGVAGGVIALLLGVGLQAAGVLPAHQSDAQSETVTALQSEIEELRQQVAALGSAGGEALAGRVAEAEQRVGTLASEIETLKTEMSQMAQAGGDAPATDLAPIEQRVATLETALAGVGGSSEPEAAVAAIEERLETLQGDVSQAREAQTAAGQRLDAVEQSLAGLTTRVEENAEAPGTAVIIAASALKAAIDRGMPFMTELETFASLAPEAPEPAELRELAATGVPTRAQIAAQSDAAAGAMIAAARPVDPEAGVIDRLWASAMGLVEVRPVGMVEGEGVPQVVARIDAAVRADDYQRAITEFETLPEGAKQAGKAFIDNVRARDAADRLIDQALAAALKA